jgi:hypothetical protein
MITGLPAPNSYDLKFLQQWLERPKLGNCAFIGGDCDVYETHKSSGLATLASRGREEDAVTRLLVNALPNIYHKAVVNPLHRICGWWIKVSLNSGVRYTCLTADYGRNRLHILITYNQNPLPWRKGSAKTPKTKCLPLPQRPNQLSLVPEKMSIWTSRVTSFSTATHIFTA